jgi:hypothetical protein
MCVSTSSDQTGRRDLKNVIEHATITRPVENAKVDRYGTPIVGERTFIDWNRFEEIHIDNLERYLNEIYGAEIELPAK